MLHVNRERTIQFVDNGKTIPLADPNPTMPIESVVKFYSTVYPSLATASLAGPEIQNDKLLYTFKTAAKTKG